MMSDLTDDLQNHLTDLKTFVDIEYANRLIERSLEALSPVLPDDVAEIVADLKNWAAQELGATKVGAGILDGAADTLERQAREIDSLKREQSAWRKFTDEANNTLDKAEQKIEQLEAALRGIAETSSSVDTRDIAEAALQENE